MVIQKEWHTILIKLVTLVFFYYPNSYLEASTLIVRMIVQSTIK